jgi:uncharacterized damage-inducible protein DinB
MTDEDIFWEPPMAGTEAAQLAGALDRLRWTFRWKADGLDATGLATRVGASEMTLGGLLQHLAVVEDVCSTSRLSGAPVGEPWASSGHDGSNEWEFRTAADLSPEELYALWAGAVDRSRARVRAALAAGGLDAPVAIHDDEGRHPTLRRLLGDLVEEYGRHTGHADLLREAVDGVVGEDPPAGWRPTGPAPETLGAGSWVPDAVAPVYRDRDLSGARFERVDLTGARLRTVDLRDVHVRGADMAGVRVQGAELDGVTLDGEVRDLRVNGVDVSAYVEAELDRRDPDRPAMRPTDADGFRRAWDVVERRWEDTVDRARGFPPEQLHASVDGEWSFVETLRHLVFATESWVGRGLLGDPSPWHAWSLPWDEMPDTPGVPRDRAVRPTLDEALALRRDRMAMVRRYVQALTDADLDREVTPPDGPGWPPPVTMPVREPLLVVLNEEYHHRLFAERDLDALAGASG